MSYLCHTAAAFVLMVSFLSPGRAEPTDISGPPRSGRFGASVTVLPNGNFVVTDPGYDAPGPIVDVGAVYLYSGASLDLISKLTGSNANDNVGSGRINAQGITVLSNGNYVVSSPYWDNGTASNAGAVTWCDGTTGLTGTISAANSLVGSTTNDKIGDDGVNGRSVNVLDNGHYVVASPNWSNGSIRFAGAVTWGSGTAGVSGIISATNSLVGSSELDQLGEGGNGTIVLSSGNYLVRSGLWDNGSLTDAGAVTWGSGTMGVRGVVSASNSLIGSSAYDSVGDLIVLLKSGNYLVRSISWDSGAQMDAGAVTWGNGTIGVKGVVSAANSLVGTTDQDQVGRDEIVLLSNGNYLVGSKDWDNAAVADPDSPNGKAMDAGAVTWGNGTIGAKGPVSAANSLIGGQAFDRVGENLSGGNAITQLSNGNYVVSSPGWHGGPAGNGPRGAVTWGSGAAGVKGTVTSANSLVGSAHFDGNDAVGSGGVRTLNDGNYLVQSPVWDNGAVRDAGAVTWGNGIGGVTGALSVSNSLVGGTAGDFAGSLTVVIGNGAYAVQNGTWDNGTVRDAGAVTWVSGSTGVKGVVSAANSLVGSAVNDMVGSQGVVALKDGNYVVLSPFWDNGGVSDAGAVTWGSGTAGVKGTVSMTNSLVGGSVNDQIGFSGISPGVTILTNGNYLVRSANWDNATVADAGALTWGSGTTGVKGLASIANSLVGDKSGDIGSSSVNALISGNYVVINSYWDNGAAIDAGAVTFGDGTTGVTGAVSELNSFVGSSTNDRVGGASFTALGNGHFLVGSPLSTKAGAVTWISGTAGLKGTPSEANSLMGGSGNDLIGFYAPQILPDNNYIISSPYWDNGAASNVGAVTWGSGLTGVKGKVSALNSLIGTTSEDSVGSLYGVTVLDNGDYMVRSSYWDNGGVTDAGALSPGDGVNGTRGIISATNSIAGTAIDGGGTMVTSHDFSRSRIIVGQPLSNRVSVFAYDPEIDITGNASVISDGDILPALIDHTDFGGIESAEGTLARTFVISNPGGFQLNLTGSPAVTISGPNASDFAVTIQPASQIAGAGTTPFQVGFSPTAPGLRRATLSIPNNDGNEGSYEFAIQGTGSGIIEYWRSSYFGQNTANTGDLEDFDSDGVANLLEFAFGTHPDSTASGPGPLQYSGPLAGGGTITATWQPIVVSEGGDFFSLYVRRKAYSIAGLDYTPQFSADLSEWQDSVTEPTVVANDGIYEVLSIPHPLPAGEGRTSFFRLKVSIVP